MTNPIGLFDSGFGGLTVLSALAERLPNEHFIYFADSARAPYGDRSSDELIAFNAEIFQFFAKLDLKLMVMACNTSCAVALPHLEKPYPFPLLDLISTTTDWLIQKSPKKVAILATNATIRSHAHKQQIHAALPDCEVLEIACPTWVPFIEGGRHLSPEFQSELSPITTQINTFQPDHIVYGCSHYPLIHALFSAHITCQPTFVNPAECMAEKVSSIVKSEARSGQIEFYVTGDIDRFKTLSAQWFDWSAFQIQYRKASVLECI